MTVEIMKIPYTHNVRQYRLPATDEGSLLRCMSISEECYLGRIDGELACVWGLIPPYLLADQAYLWLTTTDLIKEHQFLFVRHSQRLVGAMLHNWPIIVGHCDVRAERSIRWVRWLGATFGQPEGLRVPFQIIKRG